MSSSRPPELFKIVSLLTESGADFVIVGGLALQLHGGDYITIDVDFAYRRARENAKLIVAALAPFNPKPVDWPEGLPFVWDDQTVLNCPVLTLDTDLGRVDFLAQPDGAPAYSSLHGNSKVFNLNGKEVRIASIDDLIAMKRAAGRPKDIAHIAELETLKRLIEEEA